MNKKMMAIAMAAAGTALSASAGWVYPIDWGSNAAFGIGAGPDVFGLTGVAVPTTSNWYAEIVDKLTPAVVYFTATHAPDAGFWNQVGPGVAYQSLNLPDTADNRALVTRIYNHENPVMATHWIIHDPVTPVVFDWNPSADTPPTGGDAYNIGAVAQGDWVVIPEPGAAGMVVLGAAAILIRRMRERANI